MRFINSPCGWVRGTSSHPTPEGTINWALGGLYTIDLDCPRINDGYVPRKANVSSRHSISTFAQLWSVGGLCYFSQTVMKVWMSFKASSYGQIDFFSFLSGLASFSFIEGSVSSTAATLW